MRPRFDLVEVGVIGALLVLSTAALMRESPDRAVAAALGYMGARELEPFASRFGAQYSRGAEEWAVRDFFRDRRDGVFVDVGANHYRDESNTYYLETVLGWSGVAIEPQTRFAAEYRQFRPRTLFVPAFVSNASDATMVLHVPERNHLVASAEKHLAEADTGQQTSPQQVTTKTLDDILGTAGINSFDFLSMDIEWHEPQALAGFSIERYRPSLVCIEAHPQVRQQILDYFHAHGYVLVGRYLRIDPLNLYFTPATSHQPG